MNKENKKIYERAIFQTKIWKYFAWSVPIVWLATEFLLSLFGFETYANKLIIFGGVFFFVISVLWWWWAVDTIRLFAEAMQRTSQNFTDIKRELRKVREDLTK
jgi:type VI protein secretion system component VasK